MATTETPLSDFDTIYNRVFEDIKDFFRFERRHANAEEFDDAYYARAAAVMKNRIDHELKYLRSPILH